MPLAEQQVSTWCYLFVHHARVDWVNERLKDRFHTFIHKSVVYKQVKGRVKKEERPTISGLLFVQGGEKAIRQALHDIDPVLYLMNDCSTRKTAVIPDRVMQAFIRVSRMDAGRIRFMSHPLDYYSAGHPLIRITSGVLNGFEGYIVRISRDKCLVTSVGDMIVAIKGVHKEQFENIGTYVRQRRAEQQGVELMEEGASESWKHELERSFFRPENPLDVIAITDGLYRWIAEASGWMRNGNFPDAAEAVCLLLEKTGVCFSSVYADSRLGNLKEVWKACREADGILRVLETHAEVSAEVKRHIAACRQSLSVSYPFLSVKA